MGLDMYLRARIKDTQEEFYEVYWRKANQVFRYLEKNIGTIENCKEHVVPVDVVKNLLNTCIDVFDKATDGTYVTNSEYASQKLPTRSGYFFGSTEYNEYYVMEIKWTIEELTNALEVFDPERHEFVFWAWW